MKGFSRTKSLGLVFSLFFFVATAQAQTSTTPPKTKKKTTATTPAPAVRPAPRTKAPTAVRAQPAPKPVKAPRITDRHRFSLVTIEEKVNTLKEKVFRSKAQLLLLQETLLHGTISTARLKVVQENKMGNTFRLVSAAYSLNGTPIFSRSDRNGSLNKKRKIVLYQGSIRPGPCRLSIQLRFQGNGFGVFSYLRHYKFRIRSSYALTIQEGKSVEIKVIPYQKGLGVSLTKRPSVRYKVKVRKLMVRRKQIQKALSTKKK